MQGLVRYEFLVHSSVGIAPAQEPAPGSPVRIAPAPENLERCGYAHRDGFGVVTTSARYFAVQAGVRHFKVAKRNVIGCAKRLGAIDGRKPQRRQVGAIQRWHSPRPILSGWFAVPPPGALRASA